MKFGKYAELTHAEVYDKDQQYCKWIVESVTKGESSSNTSVIFATYVQYRWLLLHGKILKKAKPGCLIGQRFLVTGEPEEFPRPVLEGLIQVLGGEVVASSKRKSATGIVVAGSKQWDGRAVEESPKLQEARKTAGMEVITLEELLRRVSTSKPE